MSYTNKQANANKSRWTPPNVVRKQQKDGTFGFYNNRNCQNNFTTNSYATPPPSTRYHPYDSNTQPTTTHHDSYNTQKHINYVANQLNLNLIK